MWEKFHFFESLNLTFPLNEKTLELLIFVGLSYRGVEIFLKVGVFCQNTLIC